MGNKINILTPDKFPKLLQEIPDPPKRLFVRGALPNDDQNKFLCVVGSRQYSQYGKVACEKIIAGLRGYPIVIVSGLALGIDSIAHYQALEAGLKTIAIPGSGLHESVLYPSTNHRLAQKIIERGGALLSEFEEKFRATPWSFPQRNRIMAGISHAVLVIEAEGRSGTLITARLATEYNRDVCAVPGSIFSKNSTGAHMLIRLGATPITSSHDLLQILSFDAAGKNEQAKELELENCSNTEKKILGLLRNPLARDELIRKLGIRAPEANVLLSVMEIKGLIIERMGEIHRV
jgi:DNA processing protein